MDHVVNHINEPNDLVKLPKMYKTISGLKQSELNYYIFFINKENSLKDILESTKGKYHSDATLKIIQDDSDTSIIKISLKNDEDLEVIGVFFWEKKYPFLYLLTDFGKEREKLEKFTNHAYPFIERVSISSHKIINNILKDLLDEGYKIYSSMVSEKTWWKNEEKFRPALDYPKGIPIEDVIKGLNDKDSFINSIDINVFNNQDLRVCRLFISRKGRLKYMDGSFEIFNDFILKKILDLMNTDHSKLENRQQIGEKVKPITVNFDSKKSNPNILLKEFIGSLRDNPNISLMTHHDGNPFFYADVTDIREGSGFGVLFETKKEYSKMTLVPQEVSSPIALSKFISYIFNKFGEGKISYQND